MGIQGEDKQYSVYRYGCLGSSCILFVLVFEGAWSWVIYVGFGVIEVYESIESQFLEPLALMTILGRVDSAPLVMRIALHPSLKIIENKPPQRYRAETPKRSPTSKRTMRGWSTNCETKFTFITSILIIIKDFHTSRIRSGTFSTSSFPSPPPKHHSIQFYQFYRPISSTAMNPPASTPAPSHDQTRIISPSLPATSSLPFCPYCGCGREGRSIESFPEALVSMKKEKKAAKKQKKRMKKAEKKARKSLEKERKRRRLREVGRGLEGWRGRATMNGLSVGRRGWGVGEEKLLMKRWGHDWKGDAFPGGWEMEAGDTM
ncbi:hypothetical protein DL98DRAFT_577074 [Cadophora sp. DSE1049]|nr:hypothetical protein DL98DRAFT_577074 [Cadophora sp. DSE1049]